MKHSSKESCIEQSILEPTRTSLETSVLNVVMKHTGDHAKAGTTMFYRDRKRNSIDFRRLMCNITFNQHRRENPLFTHNRLGTLILNENVAFSFHSCITITKTIEL